MTPRRMIVAAAVQRLCGQCADACANAARLTDGGHVWEFDIDAPGVEGLWRTAVKGCGHARVPVVAAVVRQLCPYRVIEWGQGRPDRVAALDALTLPRKPNGPRRIDLADDRVKAFLAEEGEAARVLLGKCP